MKCNIRKHYQKQHLIFYGSTFKISKFKICFIKCKTPRNDKWKQWSHSSQEILSFTALLFVFICALLPHTGLLASFCCRQCYTQDSCSTNKEGGENHQASYIILGTCILLKEHQFLFKNSIRLGLLAWTNNESYFLLNGQNL